MRSRPSFSNHAGHMPCIGRGHVSCSWCYYCVAQYQFFAICSERVIISGILAAWVCLWSLHTILLACPLVLLPSHPLHVRVVPEQSEQCTYNADREGCHQCDTSASTFIIWTTWDFCKMHFLYPVALNMKPTIFPGNPPVKIIFNQL